ncbi:YgaP family membrane protein [Celeribacter marinus]|uniref:YgaP family membrane protein n=1 Tax=Celeribacter marinus TaxID=1397108 RepID=UPI003F6D4DA5
MFQKNVGGLDRILRIVVGVALIAGFFVYGNPLFLIGIVPLATGLFSSCLVYSLFGINTCPMNKR